MLVNDCKAHRIGGQKGQLVKIISQNMGPKHKLLVPEFNLNLLDKTTTAKCG